MSIEKIPSQINTIVLDIDGTILNSNNNIQDGLPDIIQKLCKSSMNIILASARPILSIAMIGAKLGIKCPFVGLNGGIVASSDLIYWTTELIITPEIHQVLMNFKDEVSMNWGHYIVYPVCGLYLHLRYFCIFSTISI